MMNVKRSNIFANLERKGFKKKKKTNHDAMVYKNKKIFAMVIVSRGTDYKEISGDLLALMARQAQLSVADFVALVDCSMSKEQYIQALEKNQKA